MTREQWFTLPMQLRRQWWEETNFDRKPPSPELKAKVDKILQQKEAARNGRPK